MMKRSIPFLFVLFMVMACMPGVPSGVISPDDMEDILYDYHVAQAMAHEERGSSGTDFNRTKYYLSVLKKYGVTEAEFDSSLVYYYSHVDYLKKIYTRVNERLSDEAKSLGANVGEIGRYSQYSTTGDTANIWKETTEVLLMPVPTMNRYDFTVKADTSFYKGDSFMLQFMSEYLWQSGAKDAVVCIVSKYEGDSIIQTVSHISSPGIAQIRVGANRENKLKEMTGFIYLSDGGDDADVRRMMFINQIQLIRFHDKETKDETTKTDTIKADTIKADSIQRTDNSGGEVSDSVRNRAVGRRLGGTPILTPQRDAVHRMEARPVELKER